MPLGRLPQYRQPLYNFFFLLSMHIFPVSGQSAPIFLCVFDGKGQNHGSRPPFSMCRVSCGKWAFRALAPNGAQGARPRTVSARKPLPKQTAKLEFARRAGGQVVTNVVCNRSLPDPLGIVFGTVNLEFDGPLERVIPNQCAHWCGNLHRISDYLSSSIRRGRVSRPPEFRDLYGAGRETRPLRCFYGWPDKFPIYLSAFVSSICIKRFTERETL